jgi:hypothetical protein
MNYLCRKDGEPLPITPIWGCRKSMGTGRVDATPVRSRKWTLLRVCGIRERSPRLACINHHRPWSMRIFLRELWVLYAARLRGEPCTLPRLPSRTRTTPSGSEESCPAHDCRFF